ncbi:MAG: NYN domain-containing protein [Nitrospirota bacterium]
MAIHLIIDGYNVIGHGGGLRADLASQRERLVRRLADYHRRRGHRVTVVFDGWRAGWPTERDEWIDGVRVIYSREGEPADEVIARLARAEGASAVVVSSDRAVQSAARAAGGVPLSCSEFLSKLSARAETPAGPSTADDAGKEDDTEEERPAVKGGNPRRKSKRERRKAAKLNKL